MKKRIKLLIVSIIIIAGIVLGINYVSNASIFDGAFGEEIVNIQDKVGEVVATYSHSTGESTQSILDRMNSTFTTENERGNGGGIMEDHMVNTFYKIPGIFCVKHRKHLRYYNGQFMDVNHGGNYNMYKKIDFDKDDAYGVKPKLKTNPTVWKTVYEAGTEGKCCESPASQTIYSNFNAVKIYSGDLHGIFTHYNDYSNNHRIPYIISFNKNTNSLQTNPSEAQKALWGFTGELISGCGPCANYGYSDCRVFEELDLHKAGIAVEQYMNVEKSHGTEPKVSLPEDAQVGAAYYSYGDDDFSEVIENMEEGLKKELETQKIISDGIVRIGPFQMSDYAYAFSEHVADYSNKGLEWDHVVAGIVAGEVVIDGNVIPIVSKEEGENFIHSSGGTVLQGTEGASIVYKDWYDQVPKYYEIGGNDVRGDASREYKTTLNGKEAEILYKPIIDNSEGAGEYTQGFTEEGALQLLPGTAKETKDKLKVKIKDENGDYTVDYPFPLPNSVFYIEVPVSLCGTAESILTSISFTYRKTESTGTGDVIISRAAKSVVEFNKSSYSGGGDVTTDATQCSTYYCQNETPSYANHHSSSTGGTHTCTYTWDCDDHYEGHGCDGHSRSGCSCGGYTTKEDGSQGSPICDGDHKKSGCHCSCPGHSATHTSLFLCTHGHSKCRNGYWKVTNSDLSTEYGQPLLRVNEAKTEVIENDVISEMEVRVLERIDTEMSIICVWHGWDAKFSRGGTVSDLLDDNGFFDGKNSSILGDVNWGANEIKSAEVGDRIVYRAVIKHTATHPMWIWVRIKYPDAMKADDLSTPQVYEDAADEFYEDRYGNSYQGGGWFSVLGSTTAAGEEIGEIEPDDLTVPGAIRTKSAKLFVYGSGYAFFFEYTFTTDIGTHEANGKTISNTPTLQITSLDYKWKILDDVNTASVNIDFNRVRGPGNTWMGPVITHIVQNDQELIVKRYVVNLNKYIYNVDHKNTAGTDTTTVHNEGTRGYEFYTDSAINKYSFADLPGIYQQQEDLKKASPVYVEYGDRVTYKIEIGNGKVTDRETVADFDYNVDEMFITLVDELPKKYSNMIITVDAWGYSKEGTKITETQGAHYAEPNYPREWDSDTAGPTIEFKDLLIPRNGVTTITVSFDVEEYEKGKIEQNKAYVSSSAIVYDYNRGRAAAPWDVKTSDVTKHTVVLGESSDWYVLNDYKIDIDKYLSSYKSTVHETNEEASRKLTSESPKINAIGIENGLSAGTQSANEDMQRMDLTYDQKFNSPVPVEKTDKLIYSIKLENLAENTLTGKASIRGNKPATQVRVSKIKETMHAGLKYLDVNAYIYADGGARQRDVTPYVNHVDVGGNVHEFKLDHVTATLLEPNEYIVFYIEVEVTESNMSLEKLFNHAELVTLSNINSPNDKNTDSTAKEARLVKTEPGVHEKEYDENTSNIETSSEFVKMKDLVIAGKVWLDKDRDGKMESEDFSLLSAEEKTRYDVTDGEAGKSDIVVRLYKKDGTLVRTTLTDDNGLYTFSKSIIVDENTNRNNMGNPGWCADSFNATTSPDGSIQYSSGTAYQRIDKATGKDSYGNYTADSEFIDYYIEYEYDGIIYKSTEVYSTGVYPPGEDEGMTNLTGNGNYNDKYEKDSNAYEKPSERETFNTKYEYISYNSAFDINKANATALEFRKDEHISELQEDKNRVVKSTSFINNKTEAYNYLWLYDYQGTGATEPNTEYLKFINLGLELREEVDIALTKDVYKVKTTINGETMEYDFNQNDGLNGSMGQGDGASGYLNDYIINKPYGLEIYESDYKFRIDQYFAEEVRNYKEITSELNIEVTYRITVDNKVISDADDIKDTGRTVTHTPLKVQVNEIMDVYEDNFIKLGARPNDEITVKTKNADGYLIDTKIKTIEAWYFKPQAGGNYMIVNSGSGEKPIYIETTSGGTHARVDLTVSADSVYTNNRADYTGYGYNKLYITGMDGEYISEDQDLDIYIKYTLDKGETEVEVTNTSHAETMTSETKSFGADKLGDVYGSYSATISVSSDGTSATMHRSLKIKDTTPNRTNPRGLENIAQVNAYSVWYEDNSPASLVDRNSNAGNLGFDNNGDTTSPDNITYYEDTTYKTGIVIAAEGTGWGKDEITSIAEYAYIEFNIIPNIKRTIEGTIWDDARTTTLGDTPEVQYIGDGVLDESTTHSMTELMNENVELNYRPDDNIKEEKDFGVRSVKAEFIEIVKVPNTDPDTTTPTENHYYEQILQNVTWEQVQNDRSDINGKYTLEGFIPGTYIVRFTYGDTVEGDATAKNDMLIFNGQDYKSTQYNPDMLALENSLNLNNINSTMNVDDVIATLEEEKVSDARDDEIRRLEVNSYSEIMTNEIAEILKGVGNGSQRNDGKGTYITTSKIKNNQMQLKTLTDNTYMYAETVEFLVKPEKLTDDQQKLTKYLVLSDASSAKEIFYEELEAVQKEERNERTFKISNIDLGIEYRPESEIRLVKEIEEVKLITEDGDTLVDLFFYTEGEDDKTTHHIDQTKSKGTELVQFVTNTYRNALLNKLTDENVQGFIYVQVDEDILQGCTIQIVYKFEAENNSQVDRIAVNLDEIRYKENPAAITLINAYPEAATLASDNYTASGVAAKVVDTDMYREDGQGLRYRIYPKVLTSETLDGTADESKAYFGRYVGFGYYTGEKSVLDTVASLKFDKILDYIDVNLEYKQESDQENTQDKFWAEIAPDDLTEHLYHLRSGINITTSVSGAKQLLNKEGYIYDTLVVSVDDRIKDDKYSSQYSSDAVKAVANGVDNSTIRNNDLSRFLLPKVTDTTAEKVKSIGTIRLPVSKVLSAETDENDMSYENMAEIIQFTTLTGRRTNFATTIGNADVQSTTANEKVGSIEFVTAALESDTAATETVTLIPPTGLMRNRRAIVNIVETAKTGVEIIFILATLVVIVIVFIAATLFAMRKYRKRRIR